MKMKLSDLPNHLTIFRVFCIPIIILCMLPQSFLYNWIAVILYALACITDFLDGYLARRLRVESKFGQFFDPIADKILVISVIFILVVIDKIDGFYVFCFWGFFVFWFFRGFVAQGPLVNGALGHGALGNGDAWFLTQMYTYRFTLQNANTDTGPFCKFSTENLLERIRFTRKNVGRGVGVVIFELWL